MSNIKEVWLEPKILNESGKELWRRVDGILDGIRFDLSVMVHDATTKDHSKFVEAGGYNIKAQLESILTKLSEASYRTERGNN